MTGGMAMDGLNMKHRDEIKHIVQKEPICAVSTAPGNGAIAVIRVSGERSIEIVNGIFEPRMRKRMRLVDMPGYSVCFGEIYETGDSGEREIIDDTIVTVFRSPRSYTGEDSIEIACHGSSYIQQEILMLLVSKGVRMAGPGEFSQRAFLNGKMDLAQAEAVADLIESENYASHKIAMQQIKGGFSSELKKMRDDMLNLVSLMELELDFSEEDVEFADRSKLRSMVDGISSHISSLIDSFKVGNVIKNGVPVTIVGATNTGKSTLLNVLLGEERAIVSNVHGTTRDSIEDCVTIGGIKFRFIDTAGIRSTDEVIEMIGIERTYSKIAQASIVILVLDADRPEFFEESLSSLLPKINADEQKLVVFLNKIDGLVADDSVKTDEDKRVTMLQQFVASDNPPVASHPAISAQISMIERIVDNLDFKPLAVIPGSAKAAVGIDMLKKVLVDTQKEVSVSSSSTLVSNVRHYEALVDAYGALGRVAIGLDDGIPTDLVSQDIREALFHIGSITGEINTEDILGNIFSRFCVGK